MAYCGKCGNQIEDGVKFCPTCGEEQLVLQTIVTDNEHETPRQQDRHAEPSPEEKLQQATATIDAMAQKFGNTADNTAEFTKEDIEANKVMALLSYFGFLVLVPIFAAKQSPFARYHANQGVVLFLALIGYGVADAVVSGILKAVLARALGLWSVYALCNSVLSLLYIAFTVLAVIGIINALNGRAKELPIIGKFRILK